MPGHKRGCIRKLKISLFGQNADDSHAHRHNRRLGIFGKLELFGIALKNQGAQMLAQGRVDFLKNFARLRKSKGKLASHSNGLATLAGKNKGSFHKNLK